MWKVVLAAAGGFLGGLFTYAVGREVVFAFRLRGAGNVIGDAITAIGSLKWVDTTLVTGMAAVAAAALSIRAVRNQMEQVDRLEAARKDAKRAAARAALPLTLSKVCDFGQQNGQLLLTLADVATHRGGFLPHKYTLPEFPSFEGSIIDDLKEMIELSDASERRVLAALLSEIQVHSARLRGLPEESRRTRGIPQLNLDTYIGDAAEIYLRASALFDFARGETASISANFDSRDAVTALHLMGLYDEERVARIAQQINRSVMRTPNI